MNNSVMYNIFLVSERDFEYRLSRAGLSFVHSNTYFLTGVIPMDSRSFDIKRNNKLLGLTDIKYYVPWIHGILNKHVCKQHVSLVSI